MPLRHWATLVVLSLLCCWPPQVTAAGQGVALRPGLTFEETTLTVQGRAIPVRVLRRGPTARLALVPAVPPNGLRQPQVLRELAKAHGAIAAINGGFFASNGFPIGTIVIDGQAASLDTRARSAIGTLNTGQVQIAPLEAKAFVTFNDYFEPVWLWGYNQPLKAGAVVLYNRWLGAPHVSLAGGQRGVRLQDGRLLEPPATGGLTLGGKPPEPEPVLASGPRKVSISNRDLPSRSALRPTLPNGPAVLGFQESSHAALRRFANATEVYEGIVLSPQWKQATHVLTAGPQVLRDGQLLTQEGNPEGFSRDVLGSANRSLVGLTRIGEILFIQIPVPVTLREAGEIAKSLGCHNALNLDGGGSSGLWMADEAGKEICHGCAGRKLGSALLLIEGTGIGGQTVPYFDGALFERWQAVREGRE